MKKKRTFYHAWRNADQKKIRIGYLSPYFYFHGMMQLGIVFLSNYDKEKFEVFVYMYGKEDEVSGFLEGRVQGWRNIGNCTADEAAKRIYEDRIDVLVDVSGNEGGRAIPILERKPAPIQMAGIGYCESTKCSAVDYFLGDAFVDDDETEKAFREELLILPQSHLCYTPACRSGSVVGPVGSPGEPVTFAGIGSLVEIKEPVLSVWAEILERVQDARLVFLAENSGNEKLRRKAFRQMKAAGIDLARLDVRDMPESLLLDFKGIDIVLDAGSGCNSCLFCDALYMGIPVIAWKGETHRERLGKGILENVGLGDLCANTGEEYVERAVMLARDRELLVALRQNLRGMMKKSFLMDEKSYMESLEQGYQMAWEHFVSFQKAPSQQESKRLATVMDELIEANERAQVFAIAEMLLAAKPQSMEIKLKLFAIYLTKEDEGSLGKVLPLFSEDSPYGKLLRARIYFIQKKWAEAKQMCQALVDQGGLPYPWGGGEYWLLAEICSKCSDTEEELRWRRLAIESKTMGNVKDRMTVYSCYLMTLQRTSQMPEFMYREACRFRDFFKDVKVFSHSRGNHHKKLRIGYISPDFHRHVVICFVQAFFAAADRDRFKIYAYTNCEEDDFSRELEKQSDVWRNIAHCSDMEVAQLIYKDQIDILVELAGHTKGNSLGVMALRPAPVQLCGIGYFATTGLPQVDYFIVDKYTAPPGEEKFFSERLLRLPHSHFCYEQVFFGDVEASTDLPCETNGFVTFGSMNNMNKVNEDVLRVWAEILERCPKARLFLKAVLLEDLSKREIESERMRKAGIDISRVIMEGPTEHYLKEYGRIDIALDPFPYPGGGTTCDALYMGVPVVTLAGNTHHERFGVSFLSNVGLEDLCAKTTEEYIDIAVNLAKDQERLRQLRKSLRDRLERSHVMNQKLYMKDLEAAYEEIWKKYEEGK